MPSRHRLPEKVRPEKVTKISAIPASPGTTAHPMFNVPPWNYVFLKVASP